MPKKARLACVTALLLLTCGCQSYNATDAASLRGVPATASTIGMVYGATRAQLDRTHAQRIIGITDDGDQGLIALAACQAYAKTVSTPK
jgi:hypothetical protein